MSLNYELGQVLWMPLLAKRVKEIWKADMSHVWLIPVADMGV